MRDAISARRSLEGSVLNVNTRSSSAPARLSISREVCVCERENEVCVCVRERERMSEVCV